MPTQQSCDCLCAEGAAAREGCDCLRQQSCDCLTQEGAAAICRKADMRLLTDGVKRMTITENDLPKLLDCQPYPPALHTEKEEIGVVNGLAWTEAGGEILEVEVNVMEGSGKLELTGNLGDVMKESAQAALSCLRSRAAVLGIEADFYKTKDIHLVEWHFGGKRQVAIAI